MILILFFIVILNAIAIALTFYCLDNIEKKEKAIFIAVGVAIIYILTSIVYWISTKDILVKEVSETGKNLITFMFVPINGIIVLPILAKSYTKYKNGKLEPEQFRNRGIVLAVIIVIILIIECSYFKEIQNGVVQIVESNKQQSIENKNNVDEQYATNVEETNIIVEQTNSINSNNLDNE